jgi:hypothetical protein
VGGWRTRASTTVSRDKGRRRAGEGSENPLDSQRRRPPAQGTPPPPLGTQHHDLSTSSSRQRPVADSLTRQIEGCPSDPRYRADLPGIAPGEQKALAEQRSAP